MNQTTPSQDSATALFNLATRMSSFVTSIDMTLMEEAGTLEKLGEKIAEGELTREQYSPIFKAMTKDEARQYNELMVEISVVSKMTLITDAERPGLSENFKRRSAVPAIKMQELLVSIAVRAGLMDEEDLVDLMPKTSDDQEHAALLNRHDAPVLALIVSEAALRP